jgi:hypothetical protein
MKIIRNMMQLLQEAASFSDPIQIVRAICFSFVGNMQESSNLGRLSGASLRLFVFLLVVAGRLCS